MNYPSGLAVDAVGYVYASNTLPGQIDVFAPGSDGSVGPIRTFTTPAPAGQSGILKLNLQYPYLFVECCGLPGDAAVFASTADGLANPLEYLTSTALSMAVAPNGSLFVSQSNAQIDVYPHPLPPVLAAPLFPSRIIRPFISNQSYDYGMAVDEKNIFVRFHGIREHLQGYMRIAVLPIGSSGPTKPTRIMRTLACRDDGSSGGLMYDLAVWGNYLYQACETPVGVFIYDKRGSGDVRPIFSLTGPFDDDYQIALGP